MPEYTAGQVVRYHHTGTLLRLLIQDAEHPSIWTVELLSWPEGRRGLVPFAAIDSYWFQPAEDIVHTRPLEESITEARVWAEFNRTHNTWRPDFTVTPPAENDPHG